MICRLTRICRVKIGGGEEQLSGGCCERGKKCIMPSFYSLHFHVLSTQRQVAGKSEKVEEIRFPLNQTSVLINVCFVEQISS